MIDSGRERRDISREAWVEEMKRRDILLETYDAAADKAKIDAEPLPDQAPVRLTLRSGSKVGTRSNPTDRRGPDKTATGEKQPVAESKPT